MRLFQVLVAACVLFQACAASQTTTSQVLEIKSSLAGVETWAMQLQGIESPGRAEALQSSNFDMLVIEPTDTVLSMENFPIHELVGKLKRRPNGKRVVIAYLNVGQAEDYRTYWGKDWKAPSLESAGSPDFLLSCDPDGWQGNYPTAYWRPEWQAHLFGDKHAQLDRILSQGFDGIYMDWVLGFSDPDVARAAKSDGVDPAQEMIDLLGKIRAYARKSNPEFVLIAQNAGYLFEKKPELLKVVDGISHEDLSFRGEASSNWDDTDTGGIATDQKESRELARLLTRIRARGVKTFTLDYTLDRKERNTCIRASRKCGAVPSVSRTPLDRLPEWPASAFRSSGR